ncbi:hypothetical protein EI555_018027 [Monodon monoceros]|uniref:Uncharacterized protein n=1 Tax=Monodon monoceros TaxID=40151 RepID=A0A4U1EZQ8_MONMO|nr:hypothetical protein EI555_018027 [Monodon monoceros]
MEKPLYPTG